jgi:hypothetical protein
MAQARRPQPCEGWNLAAKRVRQVRFAALEGGRGSCRGVVGTQLVMPKNAVAVAEGRIWRLTRHENTLCPAEALRPRLESRSQVNLRLISPVPVGNVIRLVREAESRNASAS